MSRNKTQLEVKEELFCQAYAVIESETYGKVKDSTVAAGYAEKNAKTQGWRLKRRPQVQARIQELLADNIEKHSSKVLSDLEHHRQLAIAKGDIASANKCSELLGKSLGLFYERSSPTADEIERQELDEQQRADLDEFIAFKHRQLLRPAKDDDSKASATG